MRTLIHARPAAAHLRQQLTSEQGIMVVSYCKLSLATCLIGTSGDEGIVAYAEAEVLLHRHGMNLYQGTWVTHNPNRAGGIGGAARRLCSWGESHS